MRTEGGHWPGAPPGEAPGALHGAHDGKGSEMSVEKQVKSASGWGPLFACLAGIAAMVALLVTSIVSLAQADGAGMPEPVFAVVGLVAAAVLLIVLFILLGGLFTLQPGQRRVCVLFGKYVGTVCDEGLRWANPFYAHTLGTTEEQEAEGETAGAKHGSKSRAVLSKVSVRARTLNSDHLKVNDKNGNPIEIASVVVWRVSDTAKAVFDVDDYVQFVQMQAETALRHVASEYAYDHMDDEDGKPEDAHEITLRSNVEEVSAALRRELGQRLTPAGIDVEDARLTHLAYAPEIAQAMLRRQQAEAVISARRKIVEGAVSMVNMAVRDLADSGTIDLDDERKAVMASNLMVVLCGDSEAQPVVNAGSLY